MSAERLDADVLRAALGDQPRIGNRIVVYDEVTSTNDVVAQLAAADNAEGLVVIAERQTAGRGQYGRRWVSDAGKGAWLSVLLRPRLAVSESARLTDFLAHTIATVVEAEFGIHATIKAPNDVYVQGRKVAGVLVEMRVEASGRYCAIAGIGINVNHTLEDFPPELQATAGSLRMSAGRALDRAAFLIALLRALERGYSGCDFA